MSSPNREFAIPPSSNIFGASLKKLVAASINPAAGLPDIIAKILTFLKANGERSILSAKSFILFIIPTHSNTIVDTPNLFLEPTSSNSVVRLRSKLELAHGKTIFLCWCKGHLQANNNIKKKNKKTNKQIESVVLVPSDARDVAEILKDFVKCLPQPLMKNKFLSDHLYGGNAKRMKSLLVCAYHLETTIESGNPVSLFFLFRENINVLRQHNKRLLEELLLLLHDVSRSRTSKMSAERLGFIWSQCFFPSLQNCATPAELSSSQILVTRLISWGPLLFQVHLIIPYYCITIL